MYKFVINRQCLLLLVFLLASLVQESALLSAVVSYWPLDGNATAVVGTSGTLVNAPVAANDRNGAPGGALSFSNTPPLGGNSATAQYVSVAGGGGLNNLQSGAISMWVRWSGTQDSSINSNGNVSSRQENGVFSNQILGLSGTNPATAGLTWQPYGAGAAAITGATAVGDGVWRHVAVAYASGSHQLYLDGVLQGTSATLGTISNNAGTPFTIGAWAGDGGGYSNSTMDDVAVFNAPLSAQQVALLKFNGTSPLNVEQVQQFTATLSQASTNFTSDGRLARHLTNGAGLGPDTNNNTLPEHIGSPANAMWLTAQNPPTDQRWVRFDLGGLKTLDSARVWNYNENAGAFTTNRQVASALVQYSTDGFTWTTLGGGPTAFKTTGNGAATYDDVTGIQFGGVDARYVRFGNPANPVTAVDFGNTGGGFIGLSEVQFFGTAKINVDTLLSGATATASTALGGRPASATVNGSGLAAVVGSAVPGHDTVVSNMWLSDGSAGQTTPWIRFDLTGGPSDQFLSKMLAWNSNEVNETDRGVRTANLKYATNAASFLNINDPNDPAWITLANNVDFTRADQNGGYQAVDGFYFNSMVRYVLIQVTSNYGDTQFTGLSEVQFFVPEPGSIFLILAGCALLGRFRRRIDA